MKICVCEVYVHYCDSVYDEIVKLIDHTQWQEVSEEDLANLILWAHHKNTSYSKTMKRILIIRQPTNEEVKKSLDSYLVEAKNHKNLMLEKAKKDHEKAEKLKKKEQLRKEEAERKKFEKLKTKYEQMKVKYDQSQPLS